MLLADWYFLGLAFFAPMLPLLSQISDPTRFLPANLEDTGKTGGRKWKLERKNVERVTEK